MATYYRVVNIIEESRGSVQTSDRRSVFRQKAIDMLSLSNCVCNFAMSANLTIQKACEVAINIPAFLDVINNYRQTGAQQIDLSLIMVNNPSGTIDFSVFYGFACDYVDKVNETNMVFDFSNSNVVWEYIWELVRAKEYLNYPSRLESVFLFETLSDAQKYKADIWLADPCMQVVEIETPNPSAFRFDMSWFTDVPTTATYEEAKEYARNYWGQKATSQPDWEFLYQGTYNIK